MRILRFELTLSFFQLKLNTYLVVKSVCNLPSAEIFLESFQLHSFDQSCNQNDL